MKIDHINLGHEPLILAPMEDVTDESFRLACKHFGADLVYTEFVSADALIRNIATTERKLSLTNEERPVVIQIYGREVSPMVEAAQLVERVEPDILDINFGCPVKRVAGKGAGAGMLRTPELMVEITKEVVKAVKIPVTVKTRLGWDADSRIIVDLAERLQDCGIAALAIHGRTRAQMYTGDADWTLIGDVKNNTRMSIPIIGNGDITSPDQARLAFDRYGVDGVMIGRGAIGRPWIFEEIKHFLHTGEYLPDPGFSFKIEQIKEITRRSVARLDERRGILHIRRHLAASPIFKGIADFKPTRVAMLRAETVETLFAILDEVALLRSSAIE